MFGAAPAHLLAFMIVLAAETVPLLSGEPLAWPKITRECRPATYWWWMGSAVNRANLTRELQRYQGVGIGGVHIVPIYGVKGYESRYLDYLSPEWPLYDSGLLGPVRLVRQERFMP